MAMEILVFIGNPHIVMTSLRSAGHVVVCIDQIDESKLPLMRSSGFLEPRIDDSGSLFVETADKPGIAGGFGAG